MSAKIMPFCFEGNEVRTITKGDELWFVAKDICDVLEISNSRKAVSSLDGDELMSLNVTSGGQVREMNIISESGLYTLVIRSNKPQAKPFRRWVTHEVLPAIRKHGRYAVKTKKDVQVSHIHSRTTNAPNGLDIKYNLDLTKIITKPTRNGLDILERLTGIQFSDIDLTKTDLHLDVEKYLADRYAKVVGERIPLQKMYIDYGELLGAAQPPTPRAFYKMLRVCGVETSKIGGVVYGMGLCPVWE